MSIQNSDEAIDAAFSRLSQVAFARANIFGLLAMAFFDPTPDFVEQVIDGSFVSEIHGYFQDLANRRISRDVAQEAFEPLKSAQVELSQSDPNALLMALKVEYARLFIGPGRMFVPPYETFYNSKSKDVQPLLMVSPAAIAVEKAYQDAGVAVSSDLREPPDHFATECEFLYYLSKKESDGWAEGEHEEAKQWRRLQLAFIDGHLARWGMQFCQEVEAQSRHPFYQAIAHFAQAVLQVEGSDSIESENKPDLANLQ